MPRVSCPSRGDIVWLDFDPGHKQAGRRPAVVLSHREYNLKAGLAIVCPMTSRVDKPWPFLIQVDEASAVVADQVKCVDWRGRRCELKDRLTPHALEQVVALLSRLIMPMDT